MPGTTPVERIDDLMEEASASLAQMDYFEAERLSRKALVLARKAEDFERMARICLPLQEARRQRLLQAIDAANDVRIMDEPFEGIADLTPGCVLLQPPLVAADARRVREESMARQIPVAVLCREPLTQLRLQPVVALGPVVVRTKVRPPKNAKQPEKEWFIEALEDLGDAAIEDIDPAMDPVRKIDALMDRLETVPEHERLHQVLADAAREAARSLASAGDRK